MAISAVPKNFRDGSIQGEDATGTPITVDFLYDMGDFSISGLNEGNYEIQKYLSRGELVGVRKTNRTFPQISFSAMATDYSDGTEKTALDFVQKLGAFASGVSTLGANADVWAVKITLTIEGTDHGDSADHTLVLDDCVLTIDMSEGDPNTVQISGEVLGSIAWT